MTFAHNHCPVGSGRLTILCNYGKIKNKIIICQWYILICLSRHYQKCFLPSCWYFLFFCSILCIHFARIILFVSINLWQYFATFVHSEYLYWV